MSWELVFDYDDINSADDIYASNQHHSLSTDNPLVGDRSLHVPWREGQNHMGSTWCMLADHSQHLSGLNQHGQANELRQFVSFYIDPDWTESAGGRFLASAFKVGPGDSGGGDPDGTNGWSVRHSMQNGSNGTWRMASYVYNVHGPTYTTIPDALHHGWNHIETYVRMNTWSGSTMNQDGIVRIWVDGELRLDQDNHAWTYQEDNMIERSFVNTWVVSSASPDRDYDMYYDQHAIDTSGTTPTQQFGAPETTSPTPPVLPDTPSLTGDGQNAIIIHDDQELAWPNIYRGSVELHGTDDIGVLVATGPGQTWSNFTGYLFIMRPGHNDIRIARYADGTIQTVATEGFDYTGHDEYVFDIDYRSDSGSTLSMVMYDPDLNELGSVSLDDTTHDRGYAGFYQWSRHDVWYLDQLTLEESFEPEPDPDPTPIEPSDPDDYQLIVVEPGKRFDKHLTDGEVWENVLIDITADGAGYNILATGNDWEIRNIGIRGEDNHWEHYDDPSIFGVDVPAPDATGLVENVYLGDGDTGTDHGDGSAGITVLGDLSGDLTIRNAYVAGRSEFGINAIDPGLPAFDNPGSLVLDNVYAANNTRANVHLGTQTATVDRCVAWGGERGLWQVFGHAAVTNSHLGGTADDDLAIHVGAAGFDASADASVEVTNTRFTGYTLHHDTNTLIGSSAGTPEHFVPVTVPEDAESAASGGVEALPPFHLTSAQTEDTGAVIWREDQLTKPGYTYRGDFRLLDAATDGEADFGYLFGVQPSTTSWADFSGYMAFVSTRENELHLFPMNDGELVTDSNGDTIRPGASVSGATWPTGERLRLSIDWHDSSSGTITASVTDTHGNELVSVDLDDDRYGAGHPGFYRHDAGPDWLVDNYRTSGVSPEPVEVYESWAGGADRLGSYTGDVDDYGVTTNAREGTYALERTTSGHARIMYDGPGDGPQRGTTFVQSYRPTDPDDVLMVHFAAARGSDADRYAAVADHRNGVFRFGAFINDEWSWVGDDLDPEVGLNRWMNIVVDFGDTDPDDEIIEIRYEIPGTEIDPPEVVASVTASIAAQGADDARNGGVWGYSMWNDDGRTTARVDYLRDRTEVTREWEATTRQPRTSTGAFNHMLTDLETGVRHEYRAVARSPTGTTVRGDTVRFTPEQTPDPEWDVTGPWITVSDPTDVEVTYPAEDGTAEEYFEPETEYEYRIIAAPAGEDEKVAAGAKRTFTTLEEEEEEVPDPVEPAEWTVVEDFDHRNIPGWYNGATDEYNLTSFWATSGDVSMHNATDRAGFIWTDAPSRVPERGDTIRFDMLSHFRSVELERTLRLRFRWGVTAPDTFLDCYIDIQRQEVLAAEVVDGQWTTLAQGTCGPIGRNIPFYGEVNWNDDGTFTVEFFDMGTHNSLSDRLVANPSRHDADSGGIGFVIFSRETDPITTARFDNVRVR